MSQIKIFSRIKPILNNNNTISCIDSNDEAITVKKMQKGCYKNRLIKNEYRFDHIFSHTDSNMKVYDKLHLDMMFNLLKKKRDVVFYVYGETGSGKTHTILGNSKEDGFLGIILLDMITAFKMSIQVNVVQIHNNNFYDVLNDNVVVLQQEWCNKFTLSNVKTQDISSKNDINEIKNKIIKNRTIGKSSENSESSRSHLCITIMNENQTLKILDLAGCEKGKNSICTTRKMCHENGGINKSLFFLKECIRSLVLKHKHIPYRRSELTKFLRSSFQTNCNAYILSTISQNIDNIHTTNDVLKYVCDMKNIKPRDNNLPKINNNYLIESPRYKYMTMKKDMFLGLQKKETDILEKMFLEKTTKSLFNEYVNIVDKKRQLLMNYTNNIPAPPPRKKIKPSPRLQKLNLKYKLFHGNDFC